MSPNTICAQPQLEEGMVLVAVNGDSCGGMSYEDALAMVKEAGENVHRSS